MGKFNKKKGNDKNIVANDVVQTMLYQIRWKKQTSETEKYH